VREPARVHRFIAAALDDRQQPGQRGAIARSGGVQQIGNRTFGAQRR
jgi:hypothetical protein